jgi:pimeloyl-ACP methyl ester carboxylesterase
MAPSAWHNPTTEYSLTSRALKAAAIAAIAALALTACTKDPLTDPTATGNTSTQAPAPSGDLKPVEGFETYYSQEIKWEDCGGNFQCATVQAPMNWADPASDAIDIAIKKLPSSGSAPKGTVIINPGGPGGSGIEFVDYAPFMFGATLIENYNILGFDPRGVGQSTPVKCYESEQMDHYLAQSFDPEHPKALEAARQATADYGKACLENTGAVLEFIDTQSSARDMDLLRALMGDEKINYLGFSYGTQLGATYAGIFPENVGNMVLDGAIDLRLTAFEQSMQQAVGFENALRAFAENCVEYGDCPVAGDTDQVMAAVAELFDRLGKSPLPTDDPERVLTQSLAFYGVAQPLYAEVLWPALGEGLELAINQRDGSVLLELSDDYFGRSDDGTYMNNQTEAFTAINCLDDRSSADLDTMKKEAEEIRKAAPVMGEFFTYGGISCENWPFPVAGQNFDLAASGAAPIMVIGTTNDPATPYVWAEGLAEQLESGFLVTNVGEGHTAYGMGNQCILDVVDNFFVNGTVPSSDPNCGG